MAKKKGYEASKALKDTLAVDTGETYRRRFEGWFSKEFAIKRGGEKFGSVEGPEVILGKLSEELGELTDSIWKEFQKIVLAAAKTGNDEERQAFIKRETAKLFDDTRPWWKRFYQALFRLDPGAAAKFQTILKKAAKLQSAEAKRKVSKETDLGRALREREKAFEKFKEKKAADLLKEAKRLERKTGRGFLGFGKKPPAEEDVQKVRALKLGAKQLKEGRISEKNNRRLERRFIGRSEGYKPKKGQAIAREAIASLSPQDRIEFAGAMAEHEKEIRKGVATETQKLSEKLYKLKQQEMALTIRLQSAGLLLSTDAAPGDIASSAPPTEPVPTQVITPEYIQGLTIEKYSEFVESLHKRNGELKKNLLHKTRAELNDEIRSTVKKIKHLKKVEATKEEIALEGALRAEVVQGHEAVLEAMKKIEREDRAKVLRVDAERSQQVETEARSGVESREEKKRKELSAEMRKAQRHVLKPKLAPTSTATAQKEGWLSWSGRMAGAALSAATKSRWTEELEDSRDDAPAQPPAPKDGKVEGKHAGSGRGHSKNTRRR